MSELAQVLNPGLFSRLCAADPSGSIEIVSEGTPGTYYQAAAQLGYSRRGVDYATAEHWGECYRMNCPECGDTGKHLFFSHLAGATVQVKGRARPIRFSASLCCCHRRACHRESIRFRNWLQSLELWKQPVLDLTAPKALLQSSTKYGICAYKEDKLPEPTYSLLSDQTPQAVRDYLFSRRFLPEELQDRYGVGYAPPGAVYENHNKTEAYERHRKLLDGRIIAPVVSGGVLVGWQGRLARPTVKGDLKYMTSPNLAKSRVLYNLDQALFQPYAVVVEGFFDVWRVGEKGVCPFGHDLSAAQLLQLQTVYGQSGGCLIMLDSDSNAIAYKLACKLYPLLARGAAPVYTYDNKDPDERSAENLNALLAEAEAKLKPLTAAKPVADLAALLQGLEALEESE